MDNVTWKLSTTSYATTWGMTNFNPFTLRVSLESIVYYFHNFENNLGIKRKFAKYLKESCGLTFG